MNKYQVDDMKKMKEHCNAIQDCDLCIMRKLCLDFYTSPGDWEIPKPDEEGDADD